ncbi:LapA family protein [Verminephrobacter aporrectodeae]|uniref:LapA family protein n=1 Tax=Verminephrobacter aporrectodeae subsp. tuberculatae TaxID=1110392 RepID=A0ABT3KYC0_9BURK|nr:LapA family protein [Verminephrobacter aporrectodeae]MCW5221759.1 LapA family protein [Verminephrobacter aporrectodeae subsp. tuberculatae]MCW5258069.1 LapA family protein [Verminephrobacter aporrectodeae subsp. tuberculatae]MCW5291049.1 LapA family protein [Verminephrobacter aporrectodeae subsp. tuberculatae]MCW5322790.1 LapA family protein [Verminephrobacter aporrectodeae subsp. tuberculatae]MCW8166392.1 LapA family protein [Verminephrobacter aporrectodeae subsp. tuberculatae]
MKYLLWLLKAAIFFTLFAFALNNQQEATVHFFFGTQWRAPLVLVVLAAFSAGIVVGVLGMVPRWWRHRAAARRAQAAAAVSAATAAAPPPAAAPPDLPPIHGI